MWAGARTATVDVGGVTASPQFIVELLADNVPTENSCLEHEDVSPDAACSGTESRYRITARSQGAGRAVLMLQSNFAVP